jgi:hypothetical protein
MAVGDVLGEKQARRPAMRWASRSTMVGEELREKEAAWPVTRWAAGD